MTDEPRDLPRDIGSFIRDLRASGTEVTVRTWSGAPAGFANADRPGYSAAITTASWVETAGFLAGHLRR